VHLGWFRIVDMLNTEDASFGVRCEVFNRLDIVKIFWHHLRSITPVLERTIGNRIFFFSAMYGKMPYWHHESLPKITEIVGRLLIFCSLSIRSIQMWISDGKTLSNPHFEFVRKN